MTKRKRHDSLCSSTTTTTDTAITITSEDRDETPNDHETEREKVVDEKEQCVKEEDSVAKKTKEECQQPEQEDKSEVVDPLPENVNLTNDQRKETVTSAIESSNTATITTTTTKPDNFAIRRKSNRILSLKRYHLSNVGCSSSSSEEQTPAQPKLNSETAQSSQATSTTSSSDASGSSAVAAAPSSSSTSTTSSGNAQQSKGAPRKVQVWTADDTRWFFEALCEHGKDFPHIVSYIAARCEKKGIPAESIKNYEQVRHYYYRMWHKISQMLKISNEVEKGVQELYGLINYGELWKKFGSKFDLRLSASLQQLVDVGYTVFKMKGKSVRVRTPVCNALKRIHNIDSKAASKPAMQPIPKEIEVELLPATNADWMRVHSLAQNPRLRTRLSMQHRLTTLISYLERRWSLTRVTRNAANLQSLTTTAAAAADDDALTSAAVEEGEGALPTISSVIEKGAANASAETAEAESSGSKSTKKTASPFGIRLLPTSSEKLIERLQLKSTNHSISVSNFRSTTNTNAQTDLSLSAYLKNLYAEGNNADGSGGGANSAAGNDAKGKGQFKMRKYSRKAAATTTAPQTAADTNTAAAKEDENKSEQKDSSEPKDEDEPPGGGENQVLNLFKMLDSMNAELAMPLKASKAIAGGGSNSNQSSPEKSTSEKPTDNQQSSTSSSRSEQLSPSDNFLQLFHPPDHTTLGQWLAGEKGDEMEENDTTSASGQAHSSSTSPPETAKSGGGKARRRGSLDSSEFTVLTANEARQGWTLKEAESISIGELYLLFSRPAKLVLEYSWEELKKEEEEGELKRDVEKDEQQKAAENSDKLHSTTTDMLQKLLIAANISLAKLKKPVNSLAQISANALASASSSGQTSGTSAGGGNKGGRKRPAKTQLSPPTITTTTTPQSSLLLSNLIHDTILMDCNSKDAPVLLAPTANIVTLDNSTVIAAGQQQQQPQQLIALPSNSFSAEQFVAPKRPAPRTTSFSSSQSAAGSSAATTTLPPKPTGGRLRNNLTILDDPSKVEVALSSLKDGSKLRQRRFMHNLQSKVLGTSSSSPNKLPPISGMERNNSIISSSLSNAKPKQPTFAGTTICLTGYPAPAPPPAPKPILLTTTTTTDLLSSNQQLPQEPPSTQLTGTLAGCNAPTSIVVPFMTANATDSLPIQPLQSTVCPQVPSIVISPPTAEATTTNTAFSAISAVSISSVSSEASPAVQIQPLNSINSSNFVQFVNTNTSAISTSSSSKLSAEPSDQSLLSVSKLPLSGPSVVSLSEELSGNNNSQFSWFNEHNTDSMSSLLAACDIVVANEELQRTTTATGVESVGLSLSNSEFDNHVNAMVNDNSVDLMAKFADLAAHISADSRHAL